MWGILHFQVNVVQAKKRCTNVSHSVAICFPSGHMVYILCGTNVPRTWLDAVQESVCSQQGKETLYTCIFTQPEMRQTRTRATSFLVTNTLFTTFSPDMPSQELLDDMDAGRVLCYF